MSLVLKLAPSERVFVNGAVLTNGGRRTQIIVETEAQVLRERDILPPDEPPSPVRTAYYAAQNVVLAMQTELASTAPFKAQAERLRGAFVKPEHLALLAEAEAQLERGDAYRALSLLRELVVYESAVLGLPLPERFRRTQQVPMTGVVPVAARPQAQHGATLQ
jgi:flagellar protein FlbT